MERRQRRSRQEWKQLIEDQERSGQAARAYCRSKAIGLASFYQWRRRIREGDALEEHGNESRDTFIEMGRIESTGTGPAAAPSPWLVTLELGDGLKLVLQRG